MESNNKNPQNHTTANAFLVVGGIMSFFGFIFPGWAWVLSTRGDTEMLPLAAITIVGVIGVILCIVGAVKRLKKGQVASK